MAPTVSANASGNELVLAVAADLEQEELRADQIAVLVELDRLTEDRLGQVGLLDLLEHVLARWRLARLADGRDRLVDDVRRRVGAGAEGPEGAELLLGRGDDLLIAGDAGDVRRERGHV